MISESRIKNQKGKKREGGKARKEVIELVNALSAEVLSDQKPSEELGRTLDIPLGGG